MTDPLCVAVVLNYNGRHLLQENLASVVAAAQKVEGGCDVIVLDNLSTDGSVEFVKQNYPGVIAEVAPNNRILFSYNDLCRRIRHKYVILLNNDIRVRDDSLSVLLAPCAAPDVLAVSAILYDGDGKEITRNRTLAGTHRGVFRTRFGEANEVMPTMDAGGGCAVFDREKFLALGGFDELYWPYYYEDTDLSYGAWKRGLRVLVEPRSIMYHRHAATIQHNRQNEVVCHRNACLFIWKNITDPVLLAKHVAWLAFLIPWRAIRGNWPYLRAVWTAFRKLPQALTRRREMKPLWKRTDAEVWALVLGSGPSAAPTQAGAPIKREPAGAGSVSS
jgi:N-acetylglucosaminyl-diphospho-decaprenol L-rhamnosyltransferase